MKKIILTLLAIFPVVVYAQVNCNPFASQALISSTPLQDIANSGQGTLTVNIGNSGTDPISLVTGSEMIVVISLSNGLPSTLATNPIASLGGSFFPAFNWSYSAGTNSFTGIQSTVIPGAFSGGVGTISVQYTVTTNSSMSNPQNGFNVHITPPPFLAGINTTGDDFISAFTWTTNAAPLPTTLTSFDASTQKCNVQLTWTATEMSNFKNFVVEKSLENNAAFTEIASMNPTTNIEEFSFLDTKVEKGTTYFYRLKMVDLDGAFSYSKTVYEKVACGDEIIYNVMPNPTSTTFKLNTITDLRQVIVYDAFGKKVTTKLYSDLVQNPNVSVAGLASGMYMINVIKRSGETQALKLMVN